MKKIIAAGVAALALGFGASGALATSTPDYCEAFPTKVHLQAGLSLSEKAVDLYTKAGDKYADTPELAAVFYGLADAYKPYVTWYTTVLAQCFPKVGH